MTMRQQYRSEHGAVSLFVVIFATLLMIIITLGFIQLMIKDQKQATANDLSQSAYDSAKSGVEDAKRLLLLDQACRSVAGPNCMAAAAAIASGECNTIAAVFGDPADTETLIQQDEGDDDLRQAYTCVKIDTSTNDYRSDVGLNQSDILPLKGVTDFDRIRLSWFTRADLPTSDAAVEFPATGSVELPRVAQWGPSIPPLMRAQLMQAGGNFTLADFDGERNASTLFLYPVSAGDSSLSFATVRRDSTQPQRPERAECESSFTGSIVYACSVIIDVPAPADDNVNNRNAFLRLSALYNAAHYKVELLKGEDVVPFDNVQPEVDSTGRANDMFRRVKSRVELRSQFIYPEAAIDIEGDLCKSFIITNLDSDYSNSAACTP